MTFSFVASLTALAGFILGVGWVFAGSRLFQRWGVEAHQDGILVGRRIGVVYLTIALMMILVKDAQPSELREAISLAMALGMVGLAVMGLYEFKRRAVNASMLVSVGLEIFLAVGFSWTFIAP
ncbi:hypothetical protein QGN29_11720 [Temperatibacter marinus]|uniref:Uncharacterized protein n=1 Tax=Temperatibacter marinus TaxID=1456591 RepID=A0AA52EH45_9PROT|nr:hypothetical protein [Temperatibacter marinus]WND02219.1 hypothetical protein QGN29_11720 [Temperatibacter marinus]